MRVQIKALEYWKTEHGREGCQDAHQLNESKGLFAVADGAGTTLFPAIWARILVEQFIKAPLMSVYPFEVEWWTRQAQEIYKTRIPSMAQLRDWSIQQKALSQSSDSTLATVRIVATDASSALAELLVFGDSCVIIGNRETREIRSFVLEHAAQFSQPPVCLPSLLKVFNRHFHTGSVRPEETLGPEHIVIIASDAVSKWIVGGGGGRFSDNENGSKAWQAFEAVYQCTDDSWPIFIEECRAEKEMVNDDCTALILDLKTDVSGEGVPLGTTPDQFPEVVQQRQAAFENARREGNDELVAIYYGDGRDLKDHVLGVTPQEIEHARAVADALQDVLRAFRQFQGTLGLATKMQPIWDRYRDTLLKEKCADNIRETLERNGVRLTPPPPAPPQPVPSANSTAPTDYGIQRSNSGALSLPAKQKMVAQPDEQQRAAIERTFLMVHGASYTTYNDDALLAAAQELKRIWPDYQFSEGQKNKIAEVESRVQVLGQLREALRNGNVEKIVEAASNLPEAAHAQLNTDELRYIDLAYRMRAAFNKDDDEAILATSEDFSLPENRSIFQFTEREYARIELAQKRQGALRALRAALRMGRLREIARNYNPILDSSQQLTNEERSFLQLSQEFVEAFDTNDDFALAEAYSKIKQSSHYAQDQVAFTPGESKRIEQAGLKVQASLASGKEPVAQVKGRDITLEQIRRSGIVRKAINEFWINQYQQELVNLSDEASIQERRRKIADFQKYIDPRSIAGKVLEDLIHDTLLQEWLKENNEEAAFQGQYDVRKNALSQLATFQRLVVVDYAAFLKYNRLNDEDITYIYEMFIRFESFKPFFERQQQQKWEQQRIKLGKPKPYDEWLEDSQRKSVVYYKYPADPRQRSLWMAKQLGWVG